MASCEIQDYQAGETIIEKDQAARFYYWIIDGQAQLQGKHPCLLNENFGFGQEAFADGASGKLIYMADVTALTDIQVLRLERAALLDLIAERPDIRSKALLTLASQLGSVSAPAENKQSNKNTGRLPLKMLIGWPFTMLAPIFVWWLAGHYGLQIQSAVYLGLFTMTASMWVFALVDEYIPPLIAVIAMLFIDLVPAQVALHGFYSRAFILLLGVYSLSALMVSSGLAYRLMLWSLKTLPDKPFWHRMSLTVFGFFLSITIPSSNARMSLMLPLYLEMNESLRLKDNSPEATALMSSLFAGATLFSPLLLTAKSSNLAAFTMLPRQVRHEFQGSAWLICAAVVAVGLLLYNVWLMRCRWQPKISTPLPVERIKSQIVLLGPVKAPEWVAIIAFTLFLLGTFLPQWHQSQAAWLAGLILASILVLGLLDKKSFKAKIDWPMIFFLLSLDGLTNAIHYLGLDKLIVNNIGSGFEWMDGSLVWFILLSLVVTVLLRLVLPVTAGMIMAVTVLLPMGADLGIHPWIVVFLASLFADIWFMPHQNSTFNQVINAGLTQRCDMQQFMRYNWSLNFLRIGLAFLSIPYWQWLGLHP